MRENMILLFMVSIFVGSVICSCGADTAVIKEENFIATNLPEATDIINDESFTDSQEEESEIIGEWIMTLSIEGLTGSGTSTLMFFNTIPGTGKITTEEGNQYDFTWSYSDTQIQIVVEGVDDTGVSFQSIYNGQLANSRLEGTWSFTRSDEASGTRNWEATKKRISIFTNKGFSKQDLQIQYRPTRRLPRHCFAGRDYRRGPRTAQLSPASLRGS